MKSTASAFFLLLFISGCTVLSPENLPTAELKDLQRPEKLDLQMGLELTRQRIDIFRNVISEESINAFGNETTGEVVCSYHPLGFYLNKNIFYDLNGNLSFVATRIFYPDTPKNYELMVLERSMDRDEYLKVSQKNDTITFFKKGWLKDYDYIYLSDDTILIDEGRLLSKERIFIKPNELIYDPISLFEKMGMDRIIETETGYIAPKLHVTEEYKQIDRKTIELDNSFTVIWYINGIEFKIDENLSFFIYKTPYGYEIYRGPHLEKKVVVSENKIEVAIMGKTIQTFEISLQ
ncbi:MAG: hypothetical protein JW798_09555 [Prolixibacteraceae bacterium]|nr:hypothetical protein [Prolixibacteraceae bacterium]